MIATQASIIVGGCLGIAAVVTGGAALLRMHERDQVLKRRLDIVRNAADGGPRPAAPGFVMIDIVACAGRFLARSGLLPARTLAELQATLSSASLGGNNGLALFIGSKLLLAAAMLAVAFLGVSRFSLTPLLHYALPAGGMVVGLVLPDYAVKRLRRRYLDGVSTGLPDALDMLVICAEAGLGLEPAIERVGQELQPAHPSMAKELQTTAHEMQLISDRRQVLVNMGKRTNLDSLKRLGSTLIQTMQFGTPLTQALRTLAAEMRQENMTLYEGRAAKLPVMLTFPMILFILPCVFIVVGGPAALRVMSLLGKH